ncbi:MAG: phosphonate ABC transporter, permease protein PhnE [Sphingomonas sp.]
MQDPSAILAAFDTEWQTQRARTRRFQIVTFFGVVAILSGSIWLSGVTATILGDGLFDRIGGFLSRMLPALRWNALFAGREMHGSLQSWFYGLPLWLVAIKETVEMAFAGTALAGVIAMPMAFGAAANVNRHVLLRQLIRRVFDTLRTIPDIVLALIFAVAFSIGPVAGALTLTVSTTGSLGKLFSEAIENADTRSVESVRAAGGNWLLQMRFGIVPQVLPQFLSYWLLRLEMNVSVAAALGIVGAGGIGVELDQAISFTDFSTCLAILLLLVVIIFVIDLVSEAVRHRLIGDLGKG